MAVQKKNFDWIDTIRVFSTLNIIVFHYVVALMDNPNFQDTIYKYFVGTGHFGIAAFFGISGYLVVSSLDRSPNIFEFYRRKLIRVILPFIVAYIVALLVLLAIKVIIFKPFTYSVTEIICGMLPIDLNILKFFEIKYLFLTGEWFIGTIIWIFVFSPLVYKFLRKNVPATVIGSIIIAGLVSNFLLDFETQGRIFAVQTIFFVRMPEFITGMVLFMYRDRIFKNSSCAVAIFLTVAMVIYTALSTVNSPSLWLQYYFGDVINIHFVLAAMLSVYVSFIAADFMNKNFGKVMAKFNNFKDISYMAVLIQHLIIHLFERFIDFNHIGLFGASIVFVIIMVMIVLVSELMKKYYTPFEKKLLG